MCRASRLAGVGRDGWGFLPDVAAAMGLSGARARAQAPRGSRRRLRALGLAVLGALVVSLVVSKAAQAYVYWANRTDTIGATGTIARSNLDGSGANQSFITGASSPGGVAVDAAHVYWANTGTSTIARANLDGSGANLSFITALGPGGVAVDAAHVYWANTGINGLGTIARANLDGSGANQRFITAASFPSGVAVDALTLPPPPVGVVKAPRISIAGVASSRCRRANFRAHVSVSDALKLKRVDVVLDGRRIVHTHAKRIGARVLAIRLRAGSHTLKIIATDAAGKTTVLVVHFTRCG